MSTVKTSNSETAVDYKTKMSKQSPPQKKKEKQTQNANEAARMLRFEHTKGAEWILKRSANNASRGQNEFRGPGCLLLNRLGLTVGGGQGRWGFFHGQSRFLRRQFVSRCGHLATRSVWHRSWLFEETELATCRIAARGKTRTHVWKAFTAVKRLCLISMLKNLHRSVPRARKPSYPSAGWAGTMSHMAERSWHHWVICWQHW